MTQYRVAYLPGDGVGPEVLAAARRCVDALGPDRGFGVTWDEHAIGGAAIDALGTPDEVFARIKAVVDAKRKAG